MHRKLALVGLVVTLVAATTAMAVVDTTIPAKVGLVKAAKLAKFVSKPTSGSFPLPSGPTDPSVVGAQISFFDTVSPGGGTFTNPLPAAGWTGLGNPPGVKGFKFKGKTLGNACSIVLIKPTVIKGVCKGVGVTLSTPFSGHDGIIIGIPAGSPAARYCADLGPPFKKNTSSGLKGSNAPAPGICPFVASTPTATATNTSASTATVTNTPASTSTRTATNTPASTSTATSPPASTATRTATSTNTVVPSTATSTPTKTQSPTPTNTAPICPLTAGRYIQTTTGGALHVGIFATFPFPAGGTTIQDVGAGNSNCVHQTVVPYPGGLITPLFCVPALNATTSVVQSGCGVGEIDSNGGSDFTINEQGDTSEASICGPTFHQTSCPAAGPAPDSNGLLTVKVGNGVTDTCASGTANAIVSIPVNTLTWVGLSTSDTCDMGSGFCVIENSIPCSSDDDCNQNVICPDTAANGGNGMLDVGTEVELAQFPQTLDLTTDVATASFVDQGDLDGCKKSGAGPNSYVGSGSNGANGFCLAAGNPSTCCTGVNTGTCVGPTGTCINIGAQTVSVASAGSIFSSGGPTYDLLFTTVQNSNLAGPTPGVTPATCGSPPQINFAGTVSRCVSP